MDKMKLFMAMAGGAAIDIIFRMLNGNDGNLLIHSVIFITGATVSYGLLFFAFRGRTKGKRF